MTKEQKEELTDYIDSANIMGTSPHNAFVMFCDDYEFNPKEYKQSYYESLEEAQKRLNKVRSKLGITPLSDYERAKAYNDIEKGGKWLDKITKVN